MNDAESILDLFRLDGKVAVVRGASSGLDVAFAAALAQAGADVALGARRADRLAGTAQFVEQAGRRAIAVATDVANPTSYNNLVAQTLEAFGQVDVLVNTAGVGTAVPAIRETPEQFRQVVDVNGCYWMAQVCGRVMQPGSSIINIPSVLGITTAGLAGCLRFKQGRTDRHDTRSGPAVDGTQGHSRERACPGVLRERDDRSLSRGLPRCSEVSHPGRPQG